MTWKSEKGALFHIKLECATAFSLRNSITTIPTVPESLERKTNGLLQPPSLPLGQISKL